MDTATIRAALDANRAKAAELEEKREAIVEELIALNGEYAQLQEKMALAERTVVTPQDHHVVLEPLSLTGDATI